MKTIQKIVAVGGGQLKNLETAEIDNRIIELTDKNKPKALFIPTARGDDPDYMDTFEEIYGGHHGCQTRTLTLTKGPPSFEKMSALVLDSDLIYVGGGNTYRMMKIWRRMGLDSVLTEALSRGIVLSGLSAGANCWFKYGHSNSRAHTGNPNWDFIRVSGLNFFNFTYCPHYHIEQRESSFTQMIAKRGGIGIACDNNAAIEFVGNHYRILKSKPIAKAYKMFKQNGRVVILELHKEDEYTPIVNLLDRK